MDAATPLHIVLAGNAVIGAQLLDPFPEGGLFHGCGTLRHEGVAGNDVMKVTKFCGNAITHDFAGNTVIGAQLLDPSQKEGFSMDAATLPHMKVTKFLPETP